MKCIRCIKGPGEGQIRRVKDEIAFQEVKSGNWAFCSKQTWKKEIRDASKRQKKEAIEVPSDDFNIATMIKNESNIQTEETTDGQN